MKKNVLLAIVIFLVITAGSILGENDVVLGANNQQNDLSNLINVEFEWNVNINEVVDVNDSNIIFELYDNVYMAHAMGLKNPGEMAIVIPAYVKKDGVVYKVTEISNNAFRQCHSLLYVTISEGIDRIGDYAFEYCTELKDIIIPGSVETIGTRAFFACEKLESVQTSSGLKRIDTEAFLECTKLVEFTFPDTLEYIGVRAFSKTGLTSVVIPGSIKEIKNNAFMHSSVSEVSFAEGVTSVDGFNTCEKLKSVKLADSVEIINEYAFYWCSKLETIEFGKGLKTISAYAFRDCSSLTDVVLPEGVVTIGAEAFYGCISANIDVPMSVSNVAVDAFGVGGYLEDVLNVKYNGNLDGAPWGACALNGYVEDLIVYRDNSRRELIYCSFANNESELILPEGIEIIGERAFELCRISSIVLPDSVISIGDYAFSYSSWLNTVRLSKNLKTIGDYAFYDSGDLCNIEIPDGVISIGEGAFTKAGRIKNLIIPDSVTYIGEGAFTSVVSIMYNGTAEGAPWGADYFNAYYEDNIVYTDSSKKEVVTVMNTNLGAVVIPEGVEHISDYAFGGLFSNLGITSVVLPSTLKTIGHSAFLGCSGIESIYVPKGVTTIEEYAFAGVKQVLYDGSATGAPWYAEAMGDSSSIELSSNGIYMANKDRNGILVGCVVDTTVPMSMQYRWSMLNKTTGESKIIKDWTDNDEWLSWTPSSYGEYVLTAEAQVIDKPELTVTAQTEAFEFNPYIKGKCQMPYWGEGGGYLIGVESYDNPNQSYQYEMLILDCTLLAEGKPAWVYTTNKFTVTDGAAGWCVWQPQYGYYWTLFRVYDAVGNMIDQACYPFVNAY